jgi:nucleotide-binding universal stress UspA family protein
MQIKHILVATDFSDHAGATFAHAASLARLTGARVTLLTVNETLNNDHPSYRWVEDNLKEMDKHRGRLLEEAKVALERLEVCPSVQVRAGDAAEEICAHAREDRVDLVLMGQRGLCNIKRLVLGRTVRRTLRCTDVPVMVVPPASGVASLPGYGRLLAAADFSSASRFGLRAAIRLAIVLDARVEVMHVLRIPVVAPFQAEIDSWPLVIPEDTRNELRGRLLEEVRAAGGDEGQQRCRCTVTTGYSVAETLVGAAQKVGAALITIPTHGRRRVRDVLFGSTTESVLRLARVPVLVFPVEHMGQRA